LALVYARLLRADRRRERDDRRKCEAGDLRPLPASLLPLPPYRARSLTADANARTFAASLEPLASEFNSPANVPSALWRSLAERPSAEVSCCLTDEILLAPRPPVRSS
jgi:hypothetical protein